MKKIYLLSITICFVLFLSSCQDDVFLEEVNLIQNVSSVQNESKSLKSYPSSINWELLQSVRLPSGKDVLTPWSSGSGIPTSISKEIREDIKSKDGWVIFYDGINNTGANANNWIIFYNRFTGILKGFYFWENEGQSNTSFWNLHFDGNHKLFNGVDHFTIPINSQHNKPIPTNSTIANITNNNVKSFEANAWNAFQTQLTYDPYHSNSIKLNINANSSNIAAFTFTGEFQSVSNGSIVSTASSNSSSLLANVANGMITQTGSEAQNWVVDKITKGIIKAPGANIIGGGVPGMVASGLNLVFGSFLGGSKPTTTTSTLEFSTKGSIDADLQGSIPSSGLITPFANIAVDSEEKLGVWNLESDPVIIVDQTAWGASTGGDLYSLTQAMYIESAKIVLNEKVKSMIKNYKLRAVIIYYDKFNGSKNWNNDSYSDFKIKKGNLIYKDNNNEFYSHTSIGWIGSPTYIPDPENITLSCQPYAETSGRVRKNFVVKVTLTLYPKDEYGIDEIVSTRTFLPVYKNINSSEKCLQFQFF